MLIQQEIIGWLETLEITQGGKEGELVQLFPWQKRFVRGVLAPEVLTAALSVARGNGKTTFLAGLGAAGVIGPLEERNAEVTLIASSFDQARIAFGHAKSFIEQVTDLNTREWRVTDNDQRAQIVHRPTGASLKCRGSDPKRAHGLAFKIALLDEPAQWPPSTAAKMLAAVETAQGKIPQSKVIALGTMPEDEGHWFSKWCSGGADYSQVFRAGKDDNAFHRRTWNKANPSLKWMPDLLEAIKRQSAKAKLEPDGDAMAAFLALRLNLGTPDSSKSQLLSADDWRRCEVEYAGLPAPVGPLVFGVDLGSNAAMSAVCAYWLATGRTEVMAAFPSVPELDQRGARDNVGNLYCRMQERGELMTTSGRTVNISEMLATAMLRFGAPDCVVGDRWRDAELKDALDAAGVPAGALVSRGMGFKDGGEDVRFFRRSVAEGLVSTPISLLMRSAMSGAVTVTDPAGNAKLAKGGDTPQRRFNHRDDAAAATIVAVAEGRREAEHRGLLQGGPQGESTERVMAATMTKGSESIGGNNDIVPMDF